MVQGNIFSTKRVERKKHKFDSMAFRTAVSSKVQKLHFGKTSALWITLSYRVA
jgi:hypothetical protein